jgi:hypothetical protein
MVVLYGVTTISEGWFGLGVAGAWAVAKNDKKVRNAAVVKNILRIVKFLK